MDTRIRYKLYSVDLENPTDWAEQSTHSDPEPALSAADRLGRNFLRWNRMRVVFVIAFG